jgi:hypothetical protein
VRQETVSTEKEMRLIDLEYLSVTITHFKFHVCIIRFHLISTFLIIYRSIPILLSFLAYTLVSGCVQFTFVVAVCQSLSVIPLRVNEKNDTVHDPQRHLFDCTVATCFGLITKSLSYQFRNYKVRLTSSR